MPTRNTNDQRPLGAQHLFVAAPAAGRGQTAGRPPATVATAIGSLLPTSSPVSGGEVGYRVDPWGGWEPGASTPPPASRPLTAFISAGDEYVEKEEAKTCRGLSQLSRDPPRPGVEGRGPLVATPFYS
jgi:hypothetical protein